MAVEVVSPLRERTPQDAVQRYEDGSEANWQWMALTREIAQGLVPRQQVNRILGYDASYSFRGFNGGRGFKQIEPGQYADLLALLGRP